MNIKDKDRIATMKRIALVMIAGLAAGCASVAPPPDLQAPPSEEEFRILGSDAYDEHFLTTWRRCTQFRSTSTCKNDLYGGDGGDFM